MTNLQISLEEVMEVIPSHSEGAILPFTGYKETEFFLIIPRDLKHLKLLQFNDFRKDLDKYTKYAY